MKTVLYVKLNCENSQAIEAIKAIRLCCRLPAGGSNSVPPYGGRGVDTTFIISKRISNTEYRIMNTEKIQIFHYSLFDIPCSIFIDCAAASLQVAAIVFRRTADGESTPHNNRFTCRGEAFF